jgi:uncharacterized protein (DUF2267 family)
MLSWKKRNWLTKNQPEETQLFLGVLIFIQIASALIMGIRVLLIREEIMQYDVFIAQVMEKGRLENRDQAVRITQVTLEVLGERLYRTDRDRLGSQLSNELQKFLNASPDPGPTRRHVDRFTLEEFYNRVSARAGLGLPEVRQLTQVVLNTLAEAVTPAVLDEALSRISDDFQNLTQ